MNRCCMASSLLTVFLSMSSHTPLLASKEGTMQVSYISMAAHHLHPVVFA